MISEKALNDYFSFMDDNTVNKKLIYISLQLSMFEIINYQIINRPKEFFSSDIRIIKGKLIANETKNYIVEVKELFKKDLFKASCIWYVNQKAITEEDLDILIRFRNKRNEAAHEIMDILLDSSFSMDSKDFLEIERIHKTICLWWIKEFESYVNPAFDDVDRETFDFEEAIEVQLFPIKRILKIIDSLAYNSGFTQ